MGLNTSTIQFINEWTEWAILCGRVLSWWGAPINCLQTIDDDDPFSLVPMLLRGHEGELSILDTDAPMLR